MSPLHFPGPPPSSAQFIRDFEAKLARDRAAGRPTMGFLSSIGRFLGGAARAVGRAVGILPPAAAAVAVPAARTAAAGVAGAARRFGPAAAGLALTAGAAAVGTTLAAGGGPGVSGGRGNGRFATTTTVSTIDLTTGDVVRSVNLAGSPFLMNRDIAVAKRVFRTATKLQGRLPKRTVRQSRSSQLKDQIVNNALDNALLKGACPS